LDELEVIRNWKKTHPEWARLIAEMIRDGTLKAYEPQKPEELLTVVCGPYHVGISGSRQERCAACDAILWSSPSSHELMRSHANHRILCLSCAMKETEA
jgi:hypothetical protein